jgi:hypothetical protein
MTLKDPSRRPVPGGKGESQDCSSTLLGHCRRSPLSVKWADASEHWGVREDRFWEPVNFRIRRFTDQS